MKKITIFILSFLGMLLSTSVYSQDAMQVSGLKGNLLKRVITFGDYSTSKVKAIEKSSTLSFDVADVSWSNINFSFTQTSPDGEAVVKSSSNPNSTENKQFRKSIGLSNKGKAIYSGSIAAKQNWIFYLDGVAKPSDDECGMLMGEDDTKIIITGGDETTTKDKMKHTLRFHYNFILNSEVIGKVSTDNNGEVWFKENLDGDTKLVLAAISSAILTRIGMGSF